MLEWHVAYSSLHNIYGIYKTLSTWVALNPLQDYLAIFVIFELRHKNLLLFTKTKDAHQRVGL